MIRMAIQIIIILMSLYIVVSYKNVSVKKLRTATLIKRNNNIALSDSMEVYNIFTNINSEMQSPATFFGKIFFVSYIAVRYYYHLS